MIAGTGAYDMPPGIGLLTKSVLKGCLERNDHAG